MKVWCQTGAQTVYFFDRQRTGTGGLILERQALCVGFDGAGEDHDALNETPDFGDNSQCAARTIAADSDAVPVDSEFFSMFIHPAQGRIAVLLRIRKREVRCQTV